MRLLIFVSLACVILLTLVACNSAENWNQYLGPDRNASLTGAGIARVWPEGGPAELWSFNLGEGYGGAAIFEGEVFVLDREKGEADIMRCIDLNTGEEKWSHRYQAKGEISFPGSRAVPTVDENYIWSVGPQGDFYCFDKAKRAPVWHHQIVDEFGGKPTQWGVSQSPLIYKDLVIVAPEGDQAGVVAFGKHNGELVWKSRALSGYSYHVSLTLANFGGVDQVIMISPYQRDDSTKVNEVVGFDAKSGEALWTYTGLKSFATITPATVIDEKRLFFTDCSYNGVYGPVSILIEVTREGEEFKVKELFLTEEAGCKMHPPIVFEDHLYLNSTGRPNQMVCMTMEGELCWKEKEAPGFEMGGMIMVDGLIINQNGKNGDIHLIQPSRLGYEELGKASFFSPGKNQAWAPLAFSNGKLIVRNLEKMVCVDLVNPS
ncbi:MAG: PQQ-like beta-propeller repeat protein [Bacteroidetes bacterium]|nr:PQQ-like beta-propeller repeat protein [Bacteroidota bacterium]